MEKSGVMIPSSQLSEMTGISQTQLSDYENGNKTPGLPTLAKISTALKKSMDDLCFGDASVSFIASAPDKGRLIANCVYQLWEQGVIHHHVPSEVEERYGSSYCRPPKISRKKLNVLDRDERTRMLKLATAAEPSPLAIAIELALTTGMRRGEICGLRWSDVGDHEITVNRAISLDGGTPYGKDPKTDGSHRTIPLTKRLYAVLRAIEKDSQYVARELGVPFGDPYVLGTPDPDSRPYHPTKLSKDFTTFTKMNGFEVTFHDLRYPNQNKIPTSRRCPALDLAA